MAFSPKTALGYLRRAHEQNRLAHAYLICGASGSGKRQLPAELASLVNGTDPKNVFGTNAREIFVAEPESKSRRIVIEQVRELEHALQMRSVTGGRKVAIVSDADRLQPQAANAFLKTLEEPPANSLACGVRSCWAVEAMSEKPGNWGFSRACATPGSTWRTLTCWSEPPPGPASPP